MSVLDTCEDRSPGRLMSPEFPKTRCSLWDKTSVGPPVLLHISHYRQPRVCIPEKIIKLVQHQCENYGQSSHVLIGTLVIDDDGEGVQIQVDRLDTKANVPVASSDLAIAGNTCIRLQVTNNSASERAATLDDYTRAFKDLQSRCCSKDTIDLCAFLSLCGWGSFYSSSHASVVHLDFDMVTIETMFKSTPITPVPIAVTALSKNLASSRSLSSLQGTAKSGYLTMDHTRKLLLVLESDPKTAVLPVVGIWVSGVEFIHHPFVWAACLRYIHNTHLQDRVCSPPEEFLLVLYTPLCSRPEFYQCETNSGSAILQFELSSGHEVVNMDKVLGSPGSDSFIEVNMEALQPGHKMEVFEAAKLKHLTSADLSGNHIPGQEDLEPRCAPTPHAEKVPLFQPLVPDVSVLWTESYENATYPVSHQRRATELMPQPQQLPPTGQMSSPQNFPSVKFPLQSLATPTGGCVRSTLPLQTPPLLSQHYTLAGQTGQYLAQSAQHPLCAQQISPVSNSMPHVSQAGKSQASTLLYQGSTTIHESPQPALNPHGGHQMSAGNSVLQLSQAIKSQIYPPFAQSSFVVPDSTHLFIPPSPHPSMFTPSTVTAASYNKLSVAESSRLSGAFDQHRLGTPAVTHTHSLPLAHTVNVSNGPHQFNPRMVQHSNIHQFAGPLSGPAQYQTSASGSQPLVVTTSQHMQPTFSRDSHQHRSTLRTITEETSPSPSPALHTPGQHLEQDPRSAGIDRDLTRKNSMGTPVNHSSAIYNTIPFSYQNTSNSVRPFVHPSTFNNFSPFTNSSINNSVNSCGYPINNSSQYHNTNNSGRSTSEDSGLGLTPNGFSKTVPEYGSTSTVPTLSLPPIATSTAPTDIPSSNFEPCADSIKWEQIPAEVRALFLQQSQQLKQLQQQIQALQSQQMAQSHQASATGAVSEEASRAKKPAVKYCSVAVNTTFIDDQDCSLRGHKLCGCKLSQVTPAKATRSEFTTPVTSTKQTDTVSSTFEVCHPRPAPGFVVPTSESDSVQAVSNTGHIAHRTPQGVSDTTLDEITSKDLESTVAGVEVYDMTMNSDVSDLVVSIPDFMSSVNDRSQPDTSPTSASDYYRQNQEDLNSTVGEDAADPRQYYSQLMKNIQMFLTNSGSQDSRSSLPATKKTETAPQSPTKTFGHGCESPASSLFIPEISSVSMLLGYGTDTCQSMEINALAMKYLSDEQLTHMAKLRQLAPTSSHRSSYSAKILQQVIGGYRYSAKDMSTPDVSRLGISPNDMTLATQMYLEKHGLLGNDASVLEFPVLGHELQLRTDFSLLAPESVAGRGSFNMTTNAEQPGFVSESPQTSPTKNVVPTRPLTTLETPENMNNENWLPDKRRAVSVSKDLGASPILPAVKDKLLTGSSDRGQHNFHGNTRQRNILQEVQPQTIGVKPGPTVNSREEGDKEENLLDIEMLKQMPKLL